MEAMVQELEGLKGLERSCDLNLDSNLNSSEECCEPSQDEDVAVEGILLVNCRAALRGRFPLNGTYFQIEYDIEGKTCTSFRLDGKERGTPRPR